MKEQIEMKQYIVNIKGKEVWIMNSIGLQPATIPTMKESIAIINHLLKVISKGKRSISKYNRKVTRHFYKPRTGKELIILARKTGVKYP